MTLTVINKLTSFESQVTIPWTNLIPISKGIAFINFIRYSIFIIICFRNGGPGNTTGDTF